MTYSIVNLTNAPNQSFDIVLPINGQNLRLGFYVYWNAIAQYWLMDITDKKTNKKVLTGIPLLEGMNLLAQYSYLKIGSAYFINISNTSTPPNQSNIGKDYILLWGDNV